MDIYDYYNTLGCSMESSYEEIRHAYYHRARQLHPDKTIGTKENTKEFQLLAEAWSILKDPDLRKKYDTECKQAELESNNIIVHATVHLHELQETNKKDVLSFPCRCVFKKTNILDNQGPIIKDAFTQNIISCIPYNALSTGI
ncbi:chaperone protein dnaJ 10-like [Vespa crabro]|uniref:chaperone protein dnaJ 10-like n=1 Tax=Vespa crabro TaxID=7445 RepID=UPI001F0160B6|nr:chaperone protein dnaJ 10-like [Vespa crabro]